MLENGNTVFFAYYSPSMYTADTGFYDITPYDVYELLKEAAFYDDSENQFTFISTPETEENVSVIDCPFIYQTGTMKNKNDTDDKTYYYETYYGVIPCIKPDFNIEKAPAKWIAFSDSNNSETKEYISDIVNHAAESAAFNK